MKSLKQYQQNEKNFNKIKIKLFENIKNKYGEKFFSEFWIPENFNFDLLNENTFESSFTQKMPLPFSNRQINLFITMPKKPYNDVYNFNKKGKNITGIYLYSKYKNKPVIFSFSIIKNCTYNDYIDFTFKLDILAGGKEWFNLLRFDSIGNPHPCFFEGKKVVSEESEIIYAKTPHIHKNSFENQVLSWDCLDYSPAKEVNLNIKNFNSDDKNIFKNAFLYFCKNSNIKMPINQNIIENYHFSYNKPLFDLSKICYFNDPKEM